MSVIISIIEISYHLHLDVVMEDPIPDLSTLLMLIGEMAPAQRPLR